jgi:hypothetical protein
MARNGLFSIVSINLCIFASWHNVSTNPLLCHNNHTMKHLIAKIAISLACAIILLHAIVPHHHHDCANERGLIFETEINCHCSHQHHTHDCDEHHSDHPFDICRLADMLSHLVLNTKEDEHLMAQVVKAEVHDLMTAFLPSRNAIIAATGCHCLMPAQPDVPWTLPSTSLAGCHSLRAPPLCA